MRKLFRHLEVLGQSIRVMPILLRFFEARGGHILNDFEGRGIGPIEFSLTEFPVMQQRFSGGPLPMNTARSYTVYG